MNPNTFPLDSTSISTTKKPLSFLRILNVPITSQHEKTGIPAISSSVWLEEHRSLYESNKDIRHLREDHPTKVGYQITYAMHPDHPRYEEGYVTWFVQKYKRCLELHEEYDQLVKEMILQYELEEAAVGAMLKSNS